MASTSPTREEITFWSSGYTLDPTGIRTWPFRSYRNVWADLEGLEYKPVKYKGSWQFKMHFRFGGIKPRKISVAAGAGTKSLRQFAAALGWVRAARPQAQGLGEPLVQELMASSAGFDDSVTAAILPDEDLLKRARLRFAALKPRDAIRDCATVITNRAELECPAARLKIRIEFWNTQTEDALDTLADLLSRHPDELEARALAASRLLKADDKRGVALAAVVLERNPAGWPDVALCLSGYLARRRQWDEAARALDPLSRVRPRLSDGDRQALDRQIAEIERLRANPAQAFREITLGGTFAKMKLWLPLLLFAGLLGWPLVTLAPLFGRESWQLLQLRSHGVRADLVRIAPAGGYSRQANGVFITFVSYSFAPDKRQVDARSLKDQDLRSMEPEEVVAYIKAEQRGLLSRGWFQGTAILFNSTADEVRRNPALQFATYLPGNPAVSTIGPITESRIWLTWIGVPKAMLGAVIILGAVGWTWIRNLFKRWRRRQMGFE